MCDLLWVWGKGTRQEEAAYEKEKVFSATDLGNDLATKVVCVCEALLSRRQRGGERGVKQPGSSLRQGVTRLPRFRVSHQKGSSLR